MQISKAPDGHAGQPEADQAPLQLAQKALREHAGRLQAPSAAPLTMAHHTSRRGLVDQRVVPAEPGRLLRQRPFVLSHDVFRRPPDAGLKLPPLSQPPRPRSAEPILTAQLPSNPGLFQSLDTDDLQRVFRTRHMQRQAAETEAGGRSGAQPAHGLLSSRLMCVTAPPGVRTGEDAVQFFFDHEQHQGRLGMFIMCNFARAHADTYQPYDLLAVPSEAAEAEHFIVSASGMCHFRPGDNGNSATPLHRWVREAQCFKALKHLLFFRKFAMVWTFVRWKQRHRREKFQRRAAFLERHHPMLNDAFADVNTYVADLVRRASWFSALLMCQPAM
jgi:hypothetical protein